MLTSRAGHDDDAPEPERPEDFRADVASPVETVVDVCLRDAERVGRFSERAVSRDVSPEYLDRIDFVSFLRHARTKPHSSADCQHIRVRH